MKSKMSCVKQKPAGWLCRTIRVTEKCVYTQLTGATREANSVLIVIKKCFPGQNFAAQKNISTRKIRNFMRTAGCDNIYLIQLKFMNDDGIVRANKKHLLVNGGLVCIVLVIAFSTSKLLVLLFLMAFNYFDAVIIPIFG